MKMIFEPKRDPVVAPTIRIELTESEAGSLCGELALRSTGRDCSPIILGNAEARVILIFLDLVPIGYYAIFSPLIDKVIGACTSEGRPSVEEEEPGSIFVPLTKEQFDVYGEDPEDKWTQLEQIGIEKPKSQVEKIIDEGGA